ncbi:thermonuclease family protein [bacterium]|nr:thermonuclease family protein [bacterium]MBU1994097.1 thermonuclease family protein [bacterium]
MALSVRVISNEIQKFSIGNSHFYCKHYGIVTLEKLYSHTSLSSTCQDSIQRLYKRDPNAKQFTDNILMLKQLYHVEHKDQECLLFVRGEVTLSELLLENGLALMKPGLKDDVYEYLFFKAQLEAKNEKRGMWNEDILRNCMEALYQE